MEIGDKVRVKADGSKGTVKILEGVFHRVAYIELDNGAYGEYVYFRMFTLTGGVETLTLNSYDVNELEVI